MGDILNPLINKKEGCNFEKLETFWTKQCLAKIQGPWKMCDLGTINIWQTSKAAALENASSNP